MIGVDQYTYSVAWSDEDQAHVARVAEFPLLGAHGDTAAEALEDLKIVVSSVVAWLREEGEPLPAPKTCAARI